MMSKASAYAIVKYWKAKEAIKSFFEEERGDSHIIAVILVLVIVVGLALLFRKNIANLLDDLWKKITGTTSTFTPDAVQPDAGK